MEKDIYTSKQRLLKFLGIRENFLYGDFSRKYYTKTIPKRDGSPRTIRPPKRKIKAVQRKILNDILAPYAPNRSVYGLHGAMGILQNASAHQQNLGHTLIALDIKNFFPSITVKSVARTFKKLGFEKECAAVLAKICTVDDSIPQGAPTSALLSSLVLEPADKQIFDYCRKNRVVYTRYFDDITLSGEELSDTIVDRIEAILAKQGYAMNNKKKHTFKPSDTKVVTSVVILENEFDVTAEYKGRIANAWTNYHSNPNTHNWNVLMGLMAFYLYINRYRALRFFREITGTNFRARNSLQVNTTSS